MAGIDLNIVDRGINSTSWKAEDICLTAEHLDDVMEQKTDNSGALNSLPTPFARFFVAREAFRRVTEEHMDSQKKAGFAYSQLVSDILDVYELLFNLKYHKNSWGEDGPKLEIKEWSFIENKEYIKEKMPVLYNSLNEYYKTDIKDDKLYFLIYTENGREKLLACSSPFTGFVTPPDMDKSSQNKNVVTSAVFEGEQYDDLLIRRKSGGKYFNEIKLFNEREPDFKNYMYNVLFGSDNVDSRFKSIKEYILSFKNDSEIKSDYDLKLKNITTDQNNSLVINGINLMTSDNIDVYSYFAPTLIRLPYRISREKFVTVTYEYDVESRGFDYLLPFTPKVMTLFDDGNIDSYLHVNKDSVTVSLKYCGKVYKKEYSTDPFKSGMGRILDMGVADMNFSMGIFPNILSHKEQENNYFKVFVIATDEDCESPNFNIDKVNLSFFKKGDKEYNLIKELDPTTTGAQFGVLPAVVRSNQNYNSASGSKFYELFNTSFDLVEVEIQGNKGLIIPKWEISKATNDTYTYAIDLGTSNTFISRCKYGENSMPELFYMERPMVNYLHEYPNDKQLSLSRCIEDNIFEEAKNNIKTEFLPAIIDGKDYKFPIRTALCAVRNTNEKPKLFDNHNIAFFYEKIKENDDQMIHTDIKWDKNESLLRIFIRELLLIIKCDILQRNGDLDRTRLVWFKPLSFMGNTRTIYQEIWTGESNKILSVQAANINCFSESEAPYYYFKKKNYIKNSDSVTVIDIGGGSTDFVYFKDNHPQMANSVHFGCDVLWGNGFIEFENDKQNGIYKRYADVLRFDRQDLESLNENFKNSKYSKTKDIINFWLSNSDFCDINSCLSLDFKPVFVYHFISILFYMASMFKDYDLDAPKTIVFSGNGSKYIDKFISSDRCVLKSIIDLVFSNVFGGKYSVNLELPDERKESTCYGGLYREPNAPDVPEKIYHGDRTHTYEKVYNINENYEFLKKALVDKYKLLNRIYKEVLELLKKERIIENTTNTSIYVQKAEEDMVTPFNTYYKTQIKEKYGDDVFLYDSVFFLPIINRIFEMTNI